MLRHRPPAVRQVTGWITGLPGHLDPADEARLKAIRARCPQIDAAVRHVAGFARMIKDRSGDKDTLTGWMAAVDHDLPTLRSFTRGLGRDLEAVTAGLTLPYTPARWRAPSTRSRPARCSCSDAPTTTCCGN